MTCLGRIAVIALAVAAAFAAPATSQSPGTTEGPKGPRVVASASASAALAPDAARVTFVVAVGVDGLTASAREASDRQVRKVREAIAAIPMGKAAVEVHAATPSISTLTSPPQNPGEPANVLAKKAQSAVVVTVRDADAAKLREAVARVAEAAVDQGATGPAPDARDFRRSLRLPRGLGGGGEEPDAVAGPAVEWLATGAAAARRDAIRRATADALLDARAAAGTDKLTVVEVAVMDRESYTSQAWTQRVLGDDKEPVPLDLVRVFVEVRVTCTY
jgi:uncharacterized protein YggE